MARTTIKVTNNKDSGAGSLRQAITDSQKKNGGSYDIVFQSNAKPTNSLTTGYFTIALQSPLPFIYRNDVRINVTEPRSVILVPSAASSSPNTKSGVMKSNSGGVNGSMLYIGDPNYMYPTSALPSFNPKYRWKDLYFPDVLINGVNFIRNNAKGQSGSSGSGGGLGTGGAISVFAGDLKVTNAVFQDLKATGGAGGRGSTGGEGSVFMDVFKKGDEQRGGSGGKGGASSIPLRLSVKTDAFASGSYLPNGGSGGAPGKGNSVCGGNEGASKHAGKAGGSGSNSTIFGVGGGGGGAGGGGAWNYNDYWLTCWNVPQMSFWSGGSGGRGGRGGAFAGNGGTGGRGGSANGKNLFGAGPGRTGPTTGSTGQSGDAKGSAIALWGNYARQISGPINGQTISASLKLDNVRFIGNDSAPGVVYSSENNVYVKDVLVGSDSGTLKQVNPGRSSGLGSWAGELNIIENRPSIISGVSAPRKNNVAAIPDVILEGTDLSDKFHISYEDGSSVAGITTDLTDPNNPINKVWQKIVPDRKNQILADYQSKANTSYAEAMFTAEPDALENLIWDASEKALSMGIEYVTGTDFLADEAAGAVTGFAKAHMAYMSEQVMLERNRDVALEDNRKEQEELMKNLQEQSTYQLSSVDLALERSRVVVKDFELGKDLLTFPYQEDQSVIKLDIGKQDDRTNINFYYDRGSSADLIFLTVQLSKESTNSIGLNASSTDAVLSMLSNNKKVWTLGTRVADPYVMQTDRVRSGPGGTTIVVDRSVSLDPDAIWKINTLAGSDMIYGSEGTEVITAGGDNDMIYPGFGNDSVNGSTGSDLVSYVLRPRSNEKSVPVSLTVDDKKIKVVDASDPSVEVGTLSNIELFHLFGASNVDLTGIKKPEDSNHYSVVTGAGGKLIGSAYGDQFTVSYHDDYNENIEKAYATTTTLEGGDGTDTLVINTSNAKIPLSVRRTDSGIEVVRQSDLSPLLVATGIENIQTIGVSKTQKNSTLDDIDGIQPLSMNSIDDVLPNNRFAGTRKADILNGTFLSDEITGKKGNDTLNGRGGDDLLKPGSGNNIVNGGEGDDIYDLSKKGADLLVIDSGNNKVNGFSANDHLLFDHISEYSVAESMNTKNAAQEGHNIIIQPSRNRVLYLNDGDKKFQSVGFTSGDLSKLDETRFVDGDILALPAD